MSIKSSRLKLSCCSSSVSMCSLNECRLNDGVKLKFVVKISVYWLKNWTIAVSFSWTLSMVFIVTNFLMTRSPTATISSHNFGFIFKQKFWNVSWNRIIEKFFLFLFLVSAFSFVFVTLSNLFWNHTCKETIACDHLAAIMVLFYREMFSEKKPN